MSDWTFLGPVVLTQIHTDRMIEKGRYLDELIAPADRLWLSADGVVADIDGRAVLSAHHRLHPNKYRDDNTKNYLPHRLLSFGFTGHYDLTAAHFGQAPLGCAAEDVIVEHPDRVLPEQVAGGMQVRRGDRVVELEGAEVAKPCVPYTKWLLNDQDADDETVAPNRAFLGDGMRGYILGLADRDEIIDIAPGDEVWARPANP
jgi:hypothetical protein